MICCVIFLPLHGGEGIEKKLRNIGECNAVAAGDALAGELFDEMAEKAIHRICIGEVLDPSEEVRGDGFGIGSGNTHVAAVRMIGAKRGVRISIRGSKVRIQEHVATSAFGTDMLTVESSLRFRRHDSSSLG